jgi:hypothetical protein
LLVGPVGPELFSDGKRPFYLGSVYGADFTTTMTDSNAIDPHRFYRLLSSPIPPQP